MKLASNCLIVRGHRSSSIVDVQRQSFFTLLNTEIDLYVDEQRRVDLGRLKTENIEMYNYMLENDILISNSVSQKPLSMEWDFPGEISNAILHLSGEYPINKHLIKSLEFLGVESVGLIISCKLDVRKVISLFVGTNISSINLVSTPEFLDVEKTVKKIEDKRVKSTCIFEAEDAKIERTDLGHYIVHSQEAFLPVTGCGFISKDLFSLDLLTFTESHHHNSCLNRKIAIDKEGNIKNCPSMAESFGNIKDTTLAKAIEKPGFKKYWDINKDKIHVCKDCEFRYMCTDCRAYVEDPEDMLSKPLKCGYNPYTGEWSKWSTNPLKQKAIDFYNLES